MSGRKKGGADGRAPGGGGYAKSGKPRPGTGGNRRDRLEGKGPTPPAYMRPGHPAQRAAAARAAAGRPARQGETGRGGVSRGRSDYGNENQAPRGSGDGPEVVAGRNSVVESLRARVPAMALYVAGRAQEDERVAESVQLAAETGIAVLEAGMAELDRLTGGAVHQGVALRVRPYEYAHPDDFVDTAAPVPPLIVALDGVTDPRNLGAVVRSAAAFGATGIVVPGRRSAGVTAGAWKASAGALARLPVARAVNLTRTLEAYKSHGLFVAGLDAAGATGVHDMPVADGPLVLVVGSEGRGLSRVVAGACDLLVKIPMASGTESLNAGVAASIALYEIAAARSRLR
ncbi:MAG TPA: 23S rRNA (guanosine(2251)-2'-O)-methyltransferase RlmB [Trebonia sp.]|nr:23S rRNA (guanosine(2251)-2'-O)-methyltransferase RlmB [Trebonia sp.]